MSNNMDDKMIKGEDVELLLDVFFSRIDEIKSCHMEVFYRDDELIVENKKTKTNITITPTLSGLRIVTNGRMELSCDGNAPLVKVRPKRQGQRRRRK